MTLPRQPGAPASPWAPLLWQGLPLPHQDFGGVGAVDGDGMDQQLHGLGVDGAGVRDLLVVDVRPRRPAPLSCGGGEGARLVEQMAVALPMVSQASRWRTRLLSFIISAGGQRRGDSEERELGAGGEGTVYTRRQ